MEVISTLSFPLYDRKHWQRLMPQAENTVIDGDRGIGRQTSRREWTDATHCVRCVPPHLLSYML